MKRSGRWCKRLKNEMVNFIYAALFIGMLLAFHMMAGVLETLL